MIPGELSRAVGVRDATEGGCSPCRVQSRLQRRPAVRSRFILLSLGVRVWSNSTRRSTSAVDQRRVKPDVNVFSVCQEPPAGRQPQESHCGWAVFHEMFNAHRLKEIFVSRQFGTTPEKPATDSSVRLDPHAVQRLLVERLTCDPNARTWHGRGKFGPVLCADGEHLVFIHRRVSEAQRRNSVADSENGNLQPGKNCASQVNFNVGPSVSLVAETNHGHSG